MSTTQAKYSAQAVTLEGVEVECTHCNVQMSEYTGAGQVKYFRCGRCHRWLSSTYADVLRGDAQMRTHQSGTGPAATVNFDAVKGRLERWLAAIDDNDPYRLLGVSPNDDVETVRARYRELAFVRHPDRGGSTEAMHELNEAYEKVTRHMRRREATPALASGAREHDRRPRYARAASHSHGVHG